MKTIAIDIDNVLAASAEGLVTISNQLFGIHMTIDDFGEDWSKMWGVDHEEAERRGEVLRENKYQQGYLPVDGAAQAINELGKHYKLVLVTSRPKKVEELTRNWIKQYFSYSFDTIVFADFWDDPNNSKDGHLRHKGDLFTQVGADIVIDDQLKHCGAAAEANVQAILFGNYAWNQADKLPGGTIRYKNWLEVLEGLVR